MSGGIMSWWHFVQWHFVRGHFVRWHFVCDSCEVPCSPKAVNACIEVSHFSRTLISLYAHFTLDPKIHITESLLYYRIFKYFTTMEI